MSPAIQPITPREFHEADGVHDWRVLGDGATAFFRTSSTAKSAQLVTAIAGLLGVAENPPAIDVRPGGVTVRIVTFTEDYAGMTVEDLELARRISRAAGDLGLRADPAAIQSYLIIPGASHPAEVMPFWKAVLGYEPRIDSPDADLVDPYDRGPGLWFEQMNELRPGGLGAIHVAVWVPHEQAEARVAAALAAGGRMVRDEFAPSWWTLSDAAGNEVDVATTTGRE